MVELGRYLGNYLGGSRPLKILDIRRPSGTNAHEVHWSDDGRDEGTTHVFMDRVRRTVVGPGLESARVLAINDDRRFFEAIAAGPLNGDEPEEVLRQFLKDKVDNRVELNWVAPAFEPVSIFDPPALPGDPIDIASYRIYSNGGVFTFPGAATTLEVTLSGGSTRWVSPDLAPGIWVFKVQPVDSFGNETTSLFFTAPVVIPERVDPPADPVTFILTGPTAGTLDWNPSPTAGVTEYRVYSNGGSGFPDVDTPIATVAAPTTLASLTGLVAGEHIFIVRAFKPGFDETDNFDRRAEVRLDGPSPLTYVTLVPNPPAILSAQRQPGGFIKVIVRYDAKAEDTLGAGVAIYASPVGTPIDYTAPETVLGIPAHTLAAGVMFTVETDLGPLAEVLYQVAARIVDISGNEERNEIVAIAESDATPPADIGGLTVEVV